MDEATRETLHQAYNLIKDGHNDEARAVLRPVLETNRNNVDAWWLAAFAAGNPHDQRLALLQVLRLNPDHWAARSLLDRLDLLEHVAADELTVPSRRRPNNAPPAPGQFRWVWNVVFLFGFLGFAFAGLALLASVLNLTWFDSTVEDVGSAFGVDAETGDTFGTLTGGNPYDPAQTYDIPITKVLAVTPSGSPLVATLQQDEAHVYTFYGERGQEVAALLQFAVAGDAHYVMELRDANHNRLAYGVGGYNSATVTLVHELPRAGSYMLVLIGRPAGPGGGYALGIDLLG